MKAKPIPPLRNDANAEQFVTQADLAEYDLSEFTPMQFEIVPVETARTIRGLEQETP